MNSKKTDEILYISYKLYSIENNISFNDFCYKRANDEEFEYIFIELWNKAKEIYERKKT